MQLRMAWSEKREGVLVQMIHDIETTTVSAQSTGAYARWDEGDVVARAKTRSEAAFEQLVDQYKRRAFRLAWKITCNHEDAEEVVQNAFVKAYQKLPDFRGDSRFYTWLVRITINEALMTLRKRRLGEVSIEENKVVDDEGTAFEIEETGATPEEQCVAQELRSILSAAIGELKPILGRVVQLRKIEELTTAETAEALGVPDQTVKARTFRARRLLRKKLKQRLGVTGSKTVGSLFLESRTGRRNRRHASLPAIFVEEVATKGWFASSLAIPKR